MGCCGSKEGKNTVSPEPEKKTPGVKATGRKNKGGKAKEREPLKREEMHWRRKKEEKTPGYMRISCFIILLKLLKILYWEMHYHLSSL